MPWAVPSLADLRRMVRDYVSARLPGADASVPNSPLRVMSDNQAALAALNLDYLSWISRQMLPDTAESEFLRRHGEIWLGGALPATYASGTVTLSGTAGVIVPANTLLFSGSAEYQTSAAVTLGVGATSADVTCLSPGAIGNRDAGASLSLVSAISGVDPSATVVSISGGVDAESDDHLRARVIERIQKPPMGGDADDYVAWTKSTPTVGAAVTRVWPAANEMGPGTLTLRFAMDDDRADGIPLTADLAAVESHVDVLRPVTVADFYVVAPILSPINFSISGLSPNTSAMQAAVIASVKSMLRERARPAMTKSGAHLPAQTIYKEWIIDAVMNAPGIDHATVTVSDHVPATNGHIASLGTITFA